jgi:hypothetical protein
MSEGLSQRAYAKHRGCNVSLVNRWAKAGRLAIGPDGKIDADASDKALAASMDRTRGGVGGGGAHTQAMRHEATAAPAATNRMTEAKIAAAVYDAKRKKLDFDRSVGAVIEAHAAESAAIDAFESLRRAIQQVPDRIAPAVAAETDARKVHGMLSAEYNAVLERSAAIIELLPVRQAAAL